MSKPKKFRVIRQRLWAQPEFQDYDIEKKLLWLYLQTGTPANQLGIYLFMPKYVSLETGLSIEKIESIMREFEADELIIYNRKTHEVCVLDFIETQIVKGGKSVTDCLNSDLAKVQDTSLIDAMLRYNLPLMDELTDTAKNFINSINHSDISNTTNEENINDKESMNNEVCLKNNEVCLMNNTVDNTVDNTSTNTVTSLKTDNTENKHGEVGIEADPHSIPTLTDVTDYIKNNYYADDDLATATARIFIQLNENSNWSYLERSSWTHMLINFLDKDRNKRFSSEAVESRKAEAEAKAEADYREQERQAEYERIQHERENYFRHDWNERVYVNTSKDLFNYIKSRRYTEFDYSLCSCLYDKLYVQHTLEEIFVETLYDKKIIVWDEVGNCLELNDYGITDNPIKIAVEQIKNDSWSEQYKPHLPELPKDDTPRSNTVIDDWQT